jgi:hypothetical protein
MDDVLKRVSETLTAEPVTVTVDIKPYRFWHKWFPPKKKTFHVSQITTGNLFRISKLIAGIDKKLFEGDSSLFEKNIEAMSKYMDDVIQVIAIGIHNKKYPPPKSLIDLIRDNFTAKDLMTVMAVVIKQMDVSSFMITITSIRATSILERPGVNAKSVKEVSQ